MAARLSLTACLLCGARRPSGATNSGPSERDLRDVLRHVASEAAAPGGQWKLRLHVVIEAWAKPESRCATVRHLGGLYHPTQAPLQPSASCAGGILPTKFLESVGIQVEAKYGTA
jgi:hypothetical protein